MVPGTGAAGMQIRRCFVRGGAWHRGGLAVCRAVPGTGTAGLQKQRCFARAGAWHRDAVERPGGGVANKT